MGSVQAEERNPGCRILRIISYRTRTCDTDNLCPKWIIDALRYAQLIKDDTPEHIELQVRQEKVAHRTEEKTIIELEY
jgi:Holliday junction resolvase RusA-like endonuclease